MTKRTVSMISIFIIFLIIAFFSLFVRTQDQFYRAEDEAISLVSLDYDIKDALNFYWSTTDKAYFALEFNDRDGQHRYAIITQEGGDIAYYTSQDIISEEDAESIVLKNHSPHRILQMRLALLNQVPVWEATIKNEDGTINYITINATNGQWIQSIENI